MIYLERVTKTYATLDGPVHALQDVSLEVPRGRFVAIRGPSGCGKSTLLSMIGALGSPSLGSVRVADRDLATLSVTEKARFRGERIGFVFQMFHLLPYLDVLGNVTAASLPDRRTEAVRQASELLGRFGLEPRLRHHPAELSTGERQRVAIARAMINRPDVILADEPTGNLDPESARAVLAILADYHRDGGTILLVTHDEEAAATSEQVVLMKDGQIATADGG